MNCSAVRRPLGPVKTLLRQSRQQRVLFQRSMATETTPTSTDAAAAGSIPPAGMSIRKPQKFHVIPSNNPEKPVRTGFAVYAPPTSIREAHPSALLSFHSQQVKRLDRTGARTALFSKRNPDSAKVGDVLQVSTTKGEPFAGVCLAIRRSGVDTAILLRNTLFKTGTEMWYKIYSPTVQGIEIVWRRPKRARRAKLTFMRQPKHDMGNVEHLVTAWRKSRSVFSSRGGQKGQKKGQKGAKR
ncbi:Cysteine synthase 1 [Pestalotiopsis sp. IQ-011]